MSESQSELVYYRTAELPEIELWLRDRAGNLIDFSVVGYTFQFKLGQLNQNGVFTKTTDINGFVGSGTATSGTPNVKITFAAGEIDNVAPKHWTWQLRATKDGKDRFWQGPFQLAPIIT